MSRNTVDFENIPLWWNGFKIASESSIVSKHDGTLEIDDLRTIKSKNDEGEDANLVISRTSEVRVIDQKQGIVLSSTNIPYGSVLYLRMAIKLKGNLICNWDPYNAVIISETAGKIKFSDIKEV